MIILSTYNKIAKMLKEMTDGRKVHSFAAFARQVFMNMEVESAKQPPSQSFFHLFNAAEALGTRLSI